MIEGLTDVRSLIAGLPRGSRPSAALMNALLPGRKLENVASLSIPAGERADTLNKRGIRALNNVVISSGADSLMAARGLDDHRALVTTLGNLSLKLADHLNHMPPQLELVITAARPARAEQLEAQTAFYDKHRQSYIRWVAEMTLAQGGRMTSMAHLPPGLPMNEDCNSLSRVGNMMVLGPSELKLMQRRGIVPPGWSVEHIEARGLNTGTPAKNRLGNLIIMPQAVNRWTACLENCQMPILFPSGRDCDRPELMLCARPKEGPRKGFFLYGAAEPLSMTQYRLDDLQDREIDDLPKVPAHKHTSSYPPKHARSYSH